MKHIKIKIVLNENIFIWSMTQKQTRIFIITIIENQKIMDVQYKGDKQMTQKEAENFLWNNKPERAKRTYKEEIQRQFAEQEKERFKNKIKRHAKMLAKKIKEIKHMKWLYYLARIYNFNNFEDINKWFEKYTEDWEEKREIYKNLCENIDKAYEFQKKLTTEDLRKIYKIEIQRETKTCKE